jgi:hypothetical protein
MVKENFPIFFARAQDKVKHIWDLQLDRYSGEVDQEIPWQTDQPISWRRVTKNAVVAFSKLNKGVIIRSHFLLVQPFSFSHRLSF